jgi:hypothetical protein
MKYTCPTNPRRRGSRSRARQILISLAVLGVLALATTSAFMAGGAGAIFTTNAACNGTNINIYADKGDVYLDGGPVHPGAAGLDDGSYYVKVEAPSGTLLGTSVGSGNPTPIVVSAGEFASCYQLAAIVIKASDASAGFDTTDNPGGEYKVTVSKDPLFGPGTIKSDNFKVIPQDDGGGNPQGTVNILKFYDANANGINDDGQLIAGWRMRIQDEIDYIRFTPVSIIVAPDDYVITESDPLETNWIHTTTNPVNITLGDGQTANVEFGNVCLGPGGGLTLGFWSNKNGQVTMNDGGSDSSELQMLRDLNLRAQTGSPFDPTTYASFRTWLLNANATNMAYMLSAQLAAMELNVEAGKVSGSALVYAPCLRNTAANGDSDFISINNLMTAANNALGANGNTLAGSPDRAYQECLKTTLDKANNNQNFVQAQPCPFTFAESGQLPTDKIIGQ